MVVSLEDGTALMFSRDKLDRASLPWAHLSKVDWVSASKHTQVLKCI